MKKSEYEANTNAMTEQQAKEIILKEYPDFERDVKAMETDPKASFVELLSVLESFY